MRLSQWLADRGATELALTGRSGPSSSAKSVLDDLKSRGLDIRTYQADVSSREDISSLLTDLSLNKKELAGIFHLAGVVDDAQIVDQDSRRVQKVLSPKISGAWHLHELTKEMSLDHFVLFSSIASIQGGPGQSIYAAANAFMDGLATHRQHHGLPALSINWGGWRGEGMLSALSEAMLDQYRQAGMGWIEPDQGFEALGELLSRPTAQVVVAPMEDWNKYAQIMCPRVPSLLVDLAQAHTTNVEKEASAFATKLAVLSTDEQRRFIRSQIEQILSTVLGFTEDYPFDEQQPFLDMGLDSLSTVEARNQLALMSDLPLSATLMFDYPTIDSLVSFLLETFGHGDEKNSKSTAPSDSLEETANQQQDTSLEDFLTEIEGS